jgi:2-dehydropantoate 2-reductase
MPTQWMRLGKRWQSFRVTRKLKYTGAAIRRVCIVGAGAIGGLYAGHLGSVAEVCVLTRRPEHAARLNAEGLRVSGKTALQTAVRASTRPADLGQVDLIILAVKAVDVETSAIQLADHFPGAVLMAAQNGLGSEQMIAHYGDWPIVSAAVFMAGTRHSDTHVEYEVDTATWLGPWNAGTATYADAEHIAALLVRSGLTAEALEDIDPMQWTKLIFNAAVNSVSALTDPAVSGTGHDG